jgi:beta-glucosidase/6-phospho-beta-glucosidase/beta-galactosidase
VTATTAPASPFRSFWGAGFEGADHVNGLGAPLDMVRAHGHDELLEGDYRRVAGMGLRTIRESVGWRLSESGAAGTGRFDFSRAQRRAEAAQRHGLQVLWTLMHYGTPAAVSILDPSFVARFADFAAAAARALHPWSDGPRVYTPINEISFLTWAVTQTNLVHPYRGQPVPGDDGQAVRLRLGRTVKSNLVAGALRAIAAIRAEDPTARFLHVEPLLNIVAPADAPHRAARAAKQNAYQWQAWDMLSGRLRPHLGGRPDALDLIGINYYHDNQFEHEGGRLDWHLRDPRRLPLASLLRGVWMRYGRPLMLAETSHVGSGRAAWLNDIADEVATARHAGIPVEGVCLYPVIDRPDWNDPAHWHRSGLWDVDAACKGGAVPFRRRLHRAYAKALRQAQRRLPGREAVRAHAGATPHAAVQAAEALV